MSSVSKEAIDTVKSLNSLWLNWEFEKLNELLSKDVTYVQPGFTGRTSGKEACISSYIDFCKEAKIHDYKESDFQADVIGETAVVTYLFEIYYEINNQAYREKGRDVFVLSKETGSWKVVWRTLTDIESLPV